MNHFLCTTKESNPMTIFYDLNVQHKIFLKLSMNFRRQAYRFAGVFAFKKGLFR